MPHECCSVARRTDTGESLRPPVRLRRLLSPVYSRAVLPLEHGRLAALLVVFGPRLSLAARYFCRTDLRDLRSAACVRLFSAANILARGFPVRSVGRRAVPARSVGGIHAEPNGV